MIRLFDIAVKDMRIWLRDPAALGVMLGMPVVLILILGSAFGGLGGGESFRIAIAIVNEDQASTDARGERFAVGDEIVEGFTGDEDLSELFDVDVADDAEQVRTRVERGDLAGALIIPADLSESIQAGEPVELEVLRDPGADLSAGILESVARSLASDLSRISVIAQTTGRAAGEAGLPPEALGALVGQAVSIATTEGVTPPITLDVSDVDEEAGQITPLDYYSLSMTSMFLLFGSMFGAFAFIIERREQTMARLLTTPTPRWAFVGGKMLGVLLLGVMQFAVLYAYTSYMMRVDWGASAVGTWMIAGAELAATTGLAVLIASIARTERSAGAVGPLIIQIMALLGGAFFQISVLPEWLQPIRYVSVIGWALEGFQKVQTGGEGPADLLVETGALLTFAVVFFAIGVWRLRDSR